MPVRKLKATSDPLKVAEKIVQSHPNLLAPHLVSTSQVERLIRRLIDAQAADGAAPLTGAAAAPAPSKPAAEPAAAPSPQRGGGSQWGDLNKASDEEVKAAKAAMAVDFDKHALKPGDAGYVHDKRVEIPPDEELEDNEWDDEMESMVLDEEPSLRDMLRELEAQDIS